MILFINVFIQENSGSPLGYNYSRYNLKNYSKSEIFFYTLESYKVIDWSHVIIYCELDANVPDHKSFYDKVQKIFPEAQLHRFRNIYQKDWQKAVNEICELDDDLIWYAGNHDHPYLAPNNIQLNLLVDAMLNSDEKYKGAVYSHYPDNTCCFMNESQFNWQRVSKCVCSYDFARAEGIMILNKELLKNWWFDYDYGNSKIPRADWSEVSCSSVIAKIFTPVRVLCQHFDGYTFSSYLYDPEDSPPLDIPDGFWEDNIIIDYCRNERQEGHTLINPTLRNKAVDPNGADIRGMLEDVPLFWKNRIKKINYYQPDFNLIKARNKAIYESAAARRLVMNKMLQKGVNWAELKNYRPKLSLSYLKDLLSFN